MKRGMAHADGFGIKARITLNVIIVGVTKRSSAREREHVCNRIDRL